MKSYESFNSIYETYKPIITTFVSSKIKNKDDVEDLVQGIFFKIFKSLSSFDIDKGSMNTWIYSIASNSLKNYYRKSARNKEDLTDHIDDEPSEDFNPEKMLTDNELFRKINNKIDRISQCYTDVLYLRIIEGLKYKDIADRLNISIGCVKTRLRRGRQQLNEALNK